MAILSFRRRAEPAVEAPTDTQLLSLFRTHPERAWDLFIDRHSDLILSCLRHLGFDHDEAMNRFVFVCEKLSEHRFRRLRTIRFAGSKGELTPWIRTVVQRLAINWAWSVHGRRRLFKSIEALSARHQRVFELYFWGGLTPSQVCEQLRREQPSEVTLTAVLDALEVVFSQLNETQTWRLMSQLARRRAALRIDQPDPETGLVFEPRDAEPGPETALLSKERREVLQGALEELPSRDRLILQLRLRGSARTFRSGRDRPPQPVDGEELAQIEPGPSAYRAERTGSMTAVDCLGADELELYLDDRLEAADRERAEEHLSGCQVCRRLLVRSYDARRRERPLVRTPEELKARARALPRRRGRRGSSLRLAAIAAFLVAAVGLTYLLPRSGVRSTEPELLDVLRQGSEDPRGLRAVAPDDGAEVRVDDLVLRWTGLASTKRTTVTVLDSLGNIVARNEVSDDLPELIPPLVALEPGTTYYWYVTVEFVDGSSAESAISRFILRQPSAPP